MPGAAIPDYDYVARHCRATDLAYDQNGEPSGILDTALQPKPSDTGVSVVWVDYFDGDRPKKLNCVRSVVSLGATARQRLAIIPVRVINAAISSAGGTPAVTHDPSDELPPKANAAHALVGPIPLLKDKTVREAIASAVTATELAPYKLTPP